MDLDWCLSCEKATDAAPYCSAACQNRAGPSTLPVHIHHDEQQPSRWAGNDFAGILAWAADIPAGPPLEPITPITTSSLPASPSSRAYRPPNLLKPHRKLAPPALSRAQPSSAQPLPPTPVVILAEGKPPLARSLKDASVSKTSLKSDLTDSSIATPTSSHPLPLLASKNSSFLAPIYSHVRSWVLHPSSLLPAKDAPTVFPLHSPNFPSAPHSHKQPHGFPNHNPSSLRCRPRAQPTPIPRTRNPSRAFA